MFIKVLERKVGARGFQYSFKLVGWLVLQHSKPNAVILS